MKLRIEKAIYGGSGLARIPQDEGDHGGKAAFVPLTLPGELVEAHVEEDHRSYVTTALDAVIEPSMQRIAPGCPYFPVCGGCQYQHATYATQTAMKLAILRETLARAHVTFTDTIAVLAGEPWAYRNRVRLHVSGAPGFALCYREGGSHRDLPVEFCPIAALVLQQALRGTVEAAHALGIDAGMFTEVEFFTDADEHGLLISFFTAKPEGATAVLPQICAEIAARVPALTGVALLAPADGRGRGQPVASWGIPSLLYPVGDFTYRVSAGSFFQVNRFLAPQLLELVTGGRSGALAWDLYAGVGLFAQALSRNFGQVIAVESAPSSSADLRHNLPGSAHRIVVADTLRFLETEARRKPRARPDLIVLDPPRAGLGKRVCQALASIAAPEIAYVSCDPATLARDLGQLQRSGYRLAQLTLVDLFPQTFHLETVAVLTRP